MVTTKAIAKVAAVATGLAMATSMLSLAPYAHAAALTNAQVQSILSLLTSFGADSTTIANVQASLTGGTPTGSTGGSTGGSMTSSCSFTADLTIGSKGADVTCLQNALIAAGYSIPAGATGYFGAQTQTAVSAWQKAVGISPTAGYFGSISRAHWNLGGSTGSTGSTGGTMTGTGLKVMLSPTSPSGTVLVQGQGIGDLGDFVFSNPTSAAITVTALTFGRTGVSNDSTLNNVYLYNGVNRITDSAGVSAGQFTFSNASGVFTVAAGSTYTVSVRADIATGTSGQQLGVSLVSATSSGTLDSSVVFPIMSGYQTISAANLATVDFNSTTIPSADTSVSPQSAYPVWQNTITVSTNPVKLASMKFTNLGSIDAAYLTNLRLYVDGTQVGQTIPTIGADRTATFDMSANPVMLSQAGHVIRVLADVTGGASRTVKFSIQRSSDAMFIDSQLNQPVTATKGGSSFGSVNASTITINSVNGTSGVSVTRDPASQSQAIAVGATNVKFASFDMLASGENTKISDLYVYAVTSVHAGGLDNGKIYVNGVQVGSTKDIGETSTNKTDFSLGSSLILPAGQTTIVDVYADAKTSTSTNLANGETVTVSIYGATGLANAQGQSSLNSADVPSTSVSGNAVSISSSALTATKYSGYGNQTVIAGSNNARIGSFTLSAGSTEGITVNTIVINLSTANAASVTNLTLKDSSTGTSLGTVITTPSTSNSFAVNVPIAVSSTKTFDIYANILSGANNGPVIATVDYTTTGVGNTTGTSAAVGTSSGSNVALQTITVGSGTLTVTRGAGDPVSNNVLAGASQVMVGEFNFAASNSAYTVQNLAILVPNGAATSVTNVTVSYKDINGATQTVTQALAVSATQAYATATFTGLTMYVPVNDSANLDVYVGTPTVASGAVSGAAINVTLDTGHGTNIFRATDSSGSPTTSINSLTNIASNGTFYVRKSIPTFAMLAAPSTVPSTGTALYRFSITADAAAPVEWSQLTFNVATSASTGTTSLTSVYLTDEATGNSLLDANVSPTATKAVINLNANSSNAKYQQIGAGQTKIYDLYGTVAGYTTGSTLTISLASDGSATSTASMPAQIGSGNNTVWSDRSANSHDQSTSADWTNGYLLKNFTSSATTYSK